MSKVLSNLFLLAIASLFLFVLVSPALALPDGSVADSVSEGLLFVQGSLTKDITDPSDIWTGIYGASSTFTLPDYSLLSGDGVYTYGSDSVFGNISCNPAEIVHIDYNSSGLLDKEDYTETDTSSDLTVTDGVYTNDVTGAPLATRLTFVATTQNTTATLIQALSTPISTEKYLNFGVRVQAESYNATSGKAEAQLVLSDTSAQTLSILLIEGYADYGTGNTSTGEFVTFDVDDNDVICVSAKLSDIDSWKSTITLSSISSVGLHVGSTSGKAVGSIILDVFCLSFTDVPLRFGLDRGDQLSSAEDYVYCNLSSPSSADLKVREFHADVSSCVNADIDFIKFYTSSKVYSSGYTVMTETFTVTASSLVDVDWASEVTFGTSGVYYCFAGASSLISYFAIDGTEVTLPVEEAGDIYDIVASGSLSISTSLATKTVVITRATSYAEAYEGGGIFVLLTYVTVFGLPLISILTCGLLVVGLVVWKFHKGTLVSGYFRKGRKRMYGKKGGFDDQFNRGLHKIPGTKIYFRGGTFTSLLMGVVAVVLALGVIGTVIAFYWILSYGLFG